ncbi:MAG: retron system putative HNH endonuclease [Fusobacteriaceae bacterium]
MLKIYKTPEPEFYEEFKKRNENHIKNWDDMNGYFEIKQELRAYMILEEQNFRCPYCETLINDESEGSIEHIRPKDRFPQLFLSYDNFITSCQSNYSCDNFKSNSWDDNFIDPTKENPEDYFTYDIYSGEIVPKHRDGIKKKKALKTIELLNLNHNNLKNMRRSFIKMIGKMKIEDLKYIEEQPTLLKYYKEIRSI